MPSPPRPFCVEVVSGEHTRGDEESAEAREHWDAGWGLCSRLTAACGFTNLVCPQMLRLEAVTARGLGPGGFWELLMTLDEPEPRREMKPESPVLHSARDSLVVGLTS